MIVIVVCGLRALVALDAVTLGVAPEEERSWTGKTRGWRAQGSRWTSGGRDFGG